MDYPNLARFQQLAIDNAETEYQLKQLDLRQKAEQTAYRSKWTELEKLRADLFKLTRQTGLNDNEEGKRRAKRKKLTKKIAGFEKPEPVNVAMYQVQRQMLEHKLKEILQLNASLLIWQAQENLN